MCGIIGYVGKTGFPAQPVLLGGLERLEYRGYDSAGVVLSTPEGLRVRKVNGRIQVLKDSLTGTPLEGSTGMGHTRWATHGEPAAHNAHPHTDAAGEIAIVHNGIIENYLELKAYLRSQGVVFSSETDSEVVAHLLRHHLQDTMEETLHRVLPLLEGSFALGVIWQKEPDTLYCVRKDSPLVVGMADGGSYMASDIPALLEYTRTVYLMEDMQIARLTDTAITFFDAFGQQIDKTPMVVDWTVKTAEKGGYAHYMLKEIHDIPLALRDTLSPYLAGGKDGAARTLRQEAFPLKAEDAATIHSILVLACGTAYHAGLVGRVAIEQLAGIPVSVEIASEYACREAIVGENTLCVIVSQSGETADTIAAMRKAKAEGCKVLTITNVVGSTIAREADLSMHTWAGPEIAVASTKAYVSQLMSLYLLALDLGVKRGKVLSDEESAWIARLEAIAPAVGEVLAQQDDIQRFASANWDKNSVFFLGRGMDYMLAMEASLKLKEISYIHCESYAAGELKHGTIALIEKGTLVVALATQPALLSRMRANIQEVVVRGAKVLAVTTKDTNLDEEVSEVWTLPEAHPLLMPMLAVVPMQLLAYYMALNKGCDIDKPRNLAKSVTVQ